MVFWIRSVCKWLQMPKVTRVPHCLGRKVRTYNLVHVIGPSPTLPSHFTSPLWPRSMALPPLPQTCHVLSHPGTFAAVIPSAKIALSRVPLRSWISVHSSVSMPTPPEKQNKTKQNFSQVWSLPSPRVPQLLIAFTTFPNIFVPNGWEKPGGQTQSVAGNSLWRECE